eukprot:CAMPEP_0119410982 /NCGR_PEP_ID=MMETSP1335-20130426/3849_1 /TAXON_ID=259385 /ORGANISM="Chrysoculter rhomboideus, Strain RCC1486" /LENGTH=359 /DNA_ID=CAMNT_0007435589 /DNA_START=1 /DNA_END=1080 /DNA_ORIENTATION=+
MDMGSWEELKDLGNTAFKDKRFTEAVDHFTQAIAMNAESHVLYSNRSGAYASLAKWREALEDAEACIRLKTDWAKGYSRKGAALEGLGDVAGAKQAYEAGLAVDKENATLQAALSSLLSKGTHKPAAGSSPVVSKLMMWFNYVIVACSVTYMLPLMPPRIAFYSYRVALLASAVKHGRALLAKHGGLSFALFKKAKELLNDDNWHYVALCMMFILWKPVPFAIVPMAAYAVGTILPTVDRSMVDRLPSSMQGFARPKLEFMLSHEGQQAICAFASTAEVMIVPMLFIGLLQGLRNVVILIMYCHFLSWRYNANAWTKQAVWALSENLGNLAHHRYAPRLLGILFDKCKQLIVALNKPRS